MIQDDSELGYQDSGFTVQTIGACSFYIEVKQIHCMRSSKFIVLRSSKYQDSQVNFVEVFLIFFLSLIFSYLYHSPSVLFEGKSTVSKYLTMSMIIHTRNH